jgi:hypothetical protein
MERGTFHESVLRDDRKVVAPVGFVAFTGFALFTAPVSEAVFLCPVGSIDLGNETSTHRRIFHPFNPYG